jgi:hypothetical protein
LNGDMRQDPRPDPPRRGTGVEFGVLGHLANWSQQLCDTACDALHEKLLSTTLAGHQLIVWEVSHQAQPYLKRNDEEEGKS